MPAAMQRVAIYWAPEEGDPLAAAGAAWLGRDAQGGRAVPQPSIPGLAEATAAPRHYGFHATLRPPMRLATSWQGFIAAASALAGRLAPFEMPTMAVEDYSGFLALRETAPCPALGHLADAVVRATDASRLPPSADELAKRRRANLSAEQEALLQRWGYPYVLQHWRFHMTLTRRLDAAEMARLRPAAEAHFAASLAQARRVTELAVFTQVARGPFVVRGRVRLGKEGSGLF